MFVFSLSRELYGNFIVVCVFCSHCLLLRSVTCLSPFLSYWCCWFTSNKFLYFFCVAFIYRFNVKRWYTVTLAMSPLKLLYITHSSFFSEAMRITNSFIVVDHNCKGNLIIVYSIWGRYVFTDTVVYVFNTEYIIMGILKLNTKKPIPFWGKLLN